MISQQLLAAWKQELSKQTAEVTLNRVFIGGVSREFRRRKIFFFPLPALESEMSVDLSKIIHVNSSCKL